MSTITCENIDPNAQLLTPLTAQNKLSRSTFFFVSTTYGLATAGAALVQIGVNTEACDV